MSPARCADAVPLERVLAYARGELADDDGARFEDHQFSCPACTHRLAWLTALGAAVAAAARRRGGLRMALTADTIERLDRDGVRMRHYRFGAAREVDCTVGPDDDLVVSWYEDRAGADERLDAEVVGADGLLLGRVEDLPRDRDRGLVIVADAAEALRELPDGAVVTIRLTATGPAGTRPVDTYVYRHHAYRPGD